MVEFKNPSMTSDFFQSLTPEFWLPSGSRNMLYTLKLG